MTLRGRQTGCHEMYGSVWPRGVVTMFAVGWTAHRSSGAIVLRRGRAPMERTATCQCGQASVTVSGQPSLVTACNCTWCQRRSGSVFSVASRWPLEQVLSREGEISAFQRPGASGGTVSLGFCPTCGSTVTTELDSMPGVLGIPVGAFVDPEFPPPQFVLWCDEKAAWVDFPASMVRLADQTRLADPA